VADPYLGEIRIFAFGKVPTDWAACDGSLLSITQYDQLFSVIGTIYGGDGQNTFALPDLRGRVPVCTDGDRFDQYALGALGGVETVALDRRQMPAHNHLMAAYTAKGTVNIPANGFPSQVKGDNLNPSQDRPRYIKAGVVTTLAPDSISSTGSGAPHINMQPFGVVNFCMSLTGVFPS